MTEDAKGPVVVLTGASSGLGAQLAVELGRARHARIGLMARRPEQLEAVAARVREVGGQAMVLPVDVTDAGATAAAVSRVREAIGSIDIAIANAGIGLPMTMPKYDAGLCAKTMRVNYEGATNLFAAVVPKMVEQRSGHVVGVSSVAAFRGLPASGPYSASKAALTTMLESMRLELRPLGIAVTAVHPGFIRTDMTAKNDFAMPFLMELEDAGRLLERKLWSRPREVEFPWQLATLGRLSRWLPDWIFDRVMAKPPGQKSP